jgi:hypothetical protein
MGKIERLKSLAEQVSAASGVDIHVRQSDYRISMFGKWWRVPSRYDVSVVGAVVMGPCSYESARDRILRMPIIVEAIRRDRSDG